ncbi:MAG: hypothetical protein D6820_04955 [Lentisphaerae bacterium]|nr:MAG: hypothetical protein D6820_04955 [Lentisphaerota bacterium]
MKTVNLHVPAVAELAKKYPRSTEVLILDLTYTWVPLSSPPFELLMLQAYPLVVTFGSETWRGKRPV